MDGAVIVGIAGIAGTVLGVAISAVAAGRTAKHSRLFDARVAAYSELIGALHDFRSAALTRTNLRFQRAGEAERDEARRAYRECKARSRSAMQRVEFLASRSRSYDGAPPVEVAIEKMNDAETAKALDDASKAASGEIQAIVRAAREEIGH